MSAFRIYADTSHDHEGNWIRITHELGFSSQDLMLTEEEAVELMTRLREFLDMYYETKEESPQ